MILRHCREAIGSLLVVRPALAELRGTSGIRLLFFGLTLVFGFGRALHAQFDATNTTEPGYVPYGAAAASGLDNISLGTRGLTVRLPLL